MESSAIFPYFVCERLKTICRPSAWLQDFEIGEAPTKIRAHKDHVDHVAGNVGDVDASGTSYFDISARTLARGIDDLV